MKKVLLTAITAATVILSTGCAEKEKAIATIQPQTDKCTVEGSSAPEWICVGEKLTGYYTAQGYSSASRGGHGITMDRAYNEAVGKLALTVSSDIKAKMSSFASSTGLNKYETVDTAFEKAVKQSATLQAQEVETMRHWEHPKNGGIYLMVGVKQDNVNAKAKQSALTSFKNDTALWQEFKLKKAESELDKEFPSNQSGGANTTSGM